MSAVSVAWFFFRVIPKPIRAAYPCQQAAFPLASAFVLWLLAFKSRLLGPLRRQARKLRPALVACSLVVGIGLVAWGVRATVSYFSSPPGWHPADGPNSPLGVAKGIHPGRVVWTHDPAAVSWDGNSNYYWQDQYTSFGVVESMLSRTVQKLTGEGTDAGAWEALFRYYNQTHGRGTNGYATTELVAVKINCNNASAIGPLPSNRIDATPQTVKALLRQLVNAAGVPQTNIVVYDAQRDVGRVSSYCATEFPAVQFCRYNSTNFSGPAVITFATNAVSAAASRLPPFVTNATYSVNLALLKRHCEVIDFFEWTAARGQTAISCCFKNHFGSSGSPSGMHAMIQDWRNGMGSYNAMVDLEGSRHLGGKTILYLVDGLYGGNRADAVPVRWKMPPFNSNFPASLFASQDVVAIDSVALDFLRTEWGLMPNADNFLHEAALAENPPSGFFYAPNGDGVRLGSLGVHEHWSDALSKQYSRNLRTNATGIELVPVHSVPGIALAITSPISNAVINPFTSVSLQATATSSYTGLRQVDYYGNGTFLGTGSNGPYTFVWSNPPAGNWALTAVATDAQYFSTTSSIVNVTVASNDLAVAISSPTDGAILFEGSKCTLEALTTFTSSAIRKVDFYADGVLIGTTTSAPPTVLWTATLPGAFALTAIVTDTNDFRSLSRPVTITVRPVKIAIAGNLYVDLRATNLSADGTFWTNWGSLGNFTKFGAWTYVVNIDGIPGVDLTWNWPRGFVGPDTVPDLEGSSDRSVEVWARDQSGNLARGWSNATMVAWSHRGGADGTAFSFNHNFEPQTGAALHGGPAYDLDWGDSTSFPPRKAWHHFVYTYDGGTLCRIYVDGTLRVAKNLPAPLGTYSGDPILIGGSSSASGGMPDGSTFAANFVNSVRIHGGLLSADDVATNFAAGPSVAIQPTVITQLSISNNAITFSFATILGRSYCVEFSETLNPPLWTPLSPAQTAMGPSMTVSNAPAGGGAARFYRVAMLP